MLLRLNQIELKLRISQPSQVGARFKVSIELIDIDLSEDNKLLKTQEAIFLFRANLKNNKSLAIFVGSFDLTSRENLIIVDLLAQDNEYSYFAIAQDIYNQLSKRSDFVYATTPKLELRKIIRPDIGRLRVSQANSLLKSNQTTLIQDLSVKQIDQSIKVATTTLSGGAAVDKISIETKKQGDKIIVDAQATNSSIVELFRVVNGISTKIGSTLPVDGVASLEDKQLFPGIGVSYEARGLDDKGKINSSVHSDLLVIEASSGPILMKNSSGLDRTASKEVKNFMQDLKAIVQANPRANSNQVTVSLVTSYIPLISLSHIELWRDDELLTTFKGEELSDISYRDNIIGTSKSYHNYKFIAFDKLGYSTSLSKEVTTSVAKLNLIDRKLSV